jgi:hypothetical protein
VEIDIAHLANILTAALRTVLEPDDFDVTPGALGELDVATDDWSLHIEGWPDGVAFLAIDDEPDDPAQYTAARRAVMPAEVEQALAAADREVGGALSRALAASGDPFSRAFCEVLPRVREGVAATE